MANRKRKPAFRDTWKDYFSFSNRVRRGLIVLFALIVVETATLIYLHYIPSSSAAVDVTKFKKEIDAFYASAAETGNPKSNADSADDPSEKYHSKSPYEKVNRPAPQLFSFNPNQLPPEEWKRLGFSEKQIRSIKNYESKGGHFRSKEDVKKMYAISSKEFSRIEPFILIPETIKTDDHSGGAVKSKPKLIVDIGTADTDELEKLPMVGEYLAQKISGYREKLGGFYSIEQVKEVRGMRDSTFMVILPLLILKDSANLRKININSADFNELNRHPYIDNAPANLIISYRKQHGAFREVEDLRKVALVDAELYRKIAPYLKVE